jgi:peptidoglycan/LPS O-acetylase OafA/YrhL
MARSRWARATLDGNLGVDFFFVLSGRAAGGEPKAQVQAGRFAARREQPAFRD